jgi:hypothetical protein
MSENKFEFHFHAPVGQNIAHVDHMDVHMDKDSKIQVMNADKIEAVKQEDSEQKTPCDKVAAAILAVNERVRCEPSDWAAFVAIMENKGKFPTSAYAHDAELINRICGSEVTSADSIARSIFFTKVAGVYPNWRIKQGEETRETPNKLSKYLEIGRIASEILEA